MFSNCLTTTTCEIKAIIFKYALILQSDCQNGVVIKTYIARLISLHASCVFYVTRQVCLKINTLSHARSWKYGKYSSSASHISRDAEAHIFPYFTCACVITYNIVTETPRKCQSRELLKDLLDNLPKEK